MKKHILIITLFISVFNLNGQTNVYHPFPYSNAQWRVNGSYWDCNPLCDLYQYTTGADTLISNHMYTQIIQSGKYQLTYWDSIYRGALRNDTLNKKVYFVDRDSTNEWLLYDFSLNIGDTVFGAMPGLSPGYVVINGMDSVLVGGNYHKEFLLGGESIIEGVGSTEGLLELYTNQFESGYQLVCFSNNFDNFPSSSTSCPLILQTGINVSNPTNQQLQINIFPNPFKNFTNIIFSEEQRSASIKITNIMGQEIKTMNSTGKQCVIEKGEMSNGVYFVQIIDSDKNVTNKKITIQ